MHFKERVPLGRTGLMVSRIGLASGYGVPAASIEKASHEYGINYLYVSPLLNLGNMVQAIRNLAPATATSFVSCWPGLFWGASGASVWKAL